MKLDSITYDPELKPGARNAIDVCLSVQPGERLTIITDDATAEIAASLLAAANRAGSRPRWFVLEEEAPRPLTYFPARVLDAVAESDIAIGCFQPQIGEVNSRVELIEVVERQRVRYAHMVWISPTIMQQGMRADYYKVDGLSRRVLDRVRRAERVRVTSPAGTSIEAHFDPNVRWIKTSGLIDRDHWSNLPGGEVFTAPKDVTGVFVADGTVGDYLCAKYGDISSTPLRIEVEDGMLAGASCENAELLSDFLAYCRTTTNSDRVGEFAIGTNLGVTEMVGVLLQDEKVPGVHIAFGNTCAALTGATWTSTTHIDVISRTCDIWADDRQIMARGRFLV